MVYFRLVILWLAPASLVAQIEIPAELLPAPVERPAARLKSRQAAAERPLWLSLAGKRVLGNRAHVLVQVPDRAKVPAGLRLLRPLGDGVYLAGLDLTSSLGAELLAGRASAREFGALTVLGPADRLDASLSRSPRWAADERGIEMLVSYHADVELELARRDLQQLGVTILEDSPYFQHFEVRLNPEQLRALSEADWVEYLEPSPPPPQTKENAISARLIGDDKLQADPFSLTGRGVNVGIFDGGSVAAHAEFGDRLTIVDRATVSAHATHVAGTLIAAGNDARLKGMAPAAKLFSWTFQGAVPAKIERGAADQKIAVANNSWGESYGSSSDTCGRYGTYGTQERDYDRLVREKNLTIVFAAGNDRDWNDCTILPRGGFYTIARPSTAKNIITVGAIEQRSAVAEFSSAGPMRDNRIKPDLVALGVDVLSTFQTNRSQLLSGTSMSTPAISGTAALLVERFQSRNDGKLPNAALVKAALLNTAKDLGNVGPDYVYGYGLADAVAAAKTIDANAYTIASVTAGAANSHAIDVPANTRSLRVMLVYSDADAALGSPSVVANHLELILTAPDGVTRRLPLRLNPANPTANAVEREGDRDNVKQAVVANPAAGTWRAEVRGVDIVTESQEYVVTWNLADNPVPPCTLTVSPSTQTLSEKPGFALLTVTTGNHCDPWSPQSLPSWARITGAATRRGTDLAKISLAANDTEAPRTAIVRIGDRDLKLVQTFRCRPKPIAPGETVDSALTTGDCFYDEAVNAYSKLYTFDAKQGQAINITLRSDEIDTYLVLLAPNGSVYSVNDDGLERLGTNSRIPALTGNLQLPVAGQYTIVATTFDPHELGAFSLRLEFADVAGLTPVDPAKLAGCPASITGALTDASSRLGRRGELYPAEVFQFPGRIGQEVSIEVTSPTVDLVLYLIGPNGTVAATGTDIDGSGRARITSVLRDAGNFTVEVTSFSPFARGAFTLKLEGCSRP